MRATDGSGNRLFALNVVKVSKNRLHRTPGGCYGSQQNLGARLLGDGWGKGKEESGHQIIPIYSQHLAHASTSVPVHRARMNRSVQARCIQWAMTPRGQRGNMIT